MDILRGLWSPVANVAGAAAGAAAAAIAMHLWGRFRGRLVTLRWTAQVQAFAQSASDAQHGDVQVLYNGEPTENLFVVTVRVTNDTSRDVSGLELQVGLRDGSVFLSHQAAIVGSLRALQLSTDYVSFRDELLAAPQHERATLDVRDLVSNRFFHIPVLNRQSAADFGFLVSAPAGVIPRVLVSSEHEGVTLREELPRPQAWGVRHDYAVWTGFLSALALVLVLGATGVVPLGVSVGAFLLGALALPIGAGLVKLVRASVRLLG